MSTIANFRDINLVSHDAFTNLVDAEPEIITPLSLSQNPSGAQIDATYKL